jgi:hypothetical protein
MYILLLFPIPSIIFIAMFKLLVALTTDIYFT